MKGKRRRLKAPLFFLIIITGFFYGIITFIYKDSALYADASNISSQHNRSIADPQSLSEDTSLSDSISENSKAQKEIITESSREGDAGEGREEQSEELPKTYEFKRVTEEYFKDALFIGDSRTVGIKKYAMLEGAAFFSETGMSIHNLFDKELLEPSISEEEKLTLEEVLSRKQYAKIYLMVGINELGRGSADTYFEAYKEVVNHILLLQPNALFFIEGNMNVTKQKTQEDPIFNNINITERNEKIATLADGQTIFYIDINDVITDEEGNLLEEYTFDQIHLKAKYYTIWKEFLLDHGIVK